MISQRHFKAIDDYPSKFDWPGIKGLKKGEMGSVKGETKSANFWQGKV